MKVTHYERGERNPITQSRAHSFTGLCGCGSPIMISLHGSYVEVARFIERLKCNKCVKKEVLCQKDNDVCTVI